MLESLVPIFHLLTLQNLPPDVSFANTDPATGLQRLAAPVSSEFTSGQHWLRRQFLQSFSGVPFVLLLWMSKMQCRCAEGGFRGA